MNLTKTLRRQNYDLIEGIVRNHAPLQLWGKRPLNEVEIEYEKLEHAFKSDVVLTEIKSPVLDINYSKKNEFKFNIGLTILDKLFKSMGLANFNLDSKISSGKSISISYSEAESIEYPRGEINNFLSTADLLHPNPSMLNDLNKNNILIITGTIFAKNLNIEIETDFNMNLELVASLKSMVDGKFEFNLENKTKLKMINNSNLPMPIAVKASIIDFDKGSFKDLNLITVNRNLF